MPPFDRQSAGLGGHLLDRPDRLALPERFAKWNTVWRRFARWRDAGLDEEILEALVASGAGNRAVQMIDSTVIPLPGSACGHAREGAHQHSAGAGKGGLI